MTVCIPSAMWVNRLTSRMESFTWRQMNPSSLPVVNWSLTAATLLGDAGRTHIDSAELEKPRVCLYGNPAECDQVGTAPAGVRSHLVSSSGSSTSCWRTGSSASAGVRRDVGPEPGFFKRCCWFPYPVSHRTPKDLWLSAYPPTVLVEITKRTPVLHDSPSER